MISRKPLLLACSSRRSTAKTLQHIIFHRGISHILYTSPQQHILCLTFCPALQPSSLLLGSSCLVKQTQSLSPTAGEREGKAAKNYLRKCADILLLDLLQIHKGSTLPKTEKRKHSKSRCLPLTLHIKRSRKREITPPW